MHPSPNCAPNRTIERYVSATREHHRKAVNEVVDMIDYVLASEVPGSKIDTKVVAKWSPSGRDMLAAKKDEMKESHNLTVKRGFGAGGR